MTGTGGPIDVLVVGGYLGAGKTSLVNHLLLAGTGRRTVVLVNDFGKLAIDEELIAASAEGVITLTNGCVCCTMVSPLIDTLAALRAAEPRPELLVIEASGVADPASISHHAFTPGFRLEGIVVVADAETVQARARHDLVGRTVLRQLDAAGLVVLNKVDLVEAEQRAALHDWLAQVAPSARVLDAQHGRVPPALLAGSWPAHTAPHRHGDPADLVHTTVTFEAAGVLDRAALAAVLDDPSYGVVRAKGVVVLADAPNRPFVLQLVGRRWQLTPAATGSAAPSGTRVVLIGLQGELDADRALAALRACLLPT